MQMTLFFFLSAQISLGEKKKPRSLFRKKKKIQGNKKKKNKRKKSFSKWMLMFPENDLLHHCQHHVARRKIYFPWKIIKMKRLTSDS